MSPYIYPGLTKVETAITVGMIYDKKTVDRVRKMCCEAMNIQEALFLSKSRKSEAVIARQLNTYFLRRLKFSLKLLELITNQDHTTHIHSSKAIKNLMDTDSKFSQFVNNLEDKIRAPYVEQHT